MTRHCQGPRAKRSRAVLDCFVALAMTILLTSCSTQTEHFYAFGTEVTVELQDVSRSDAKTIFKEIDQQLQDMHHRWHAWQDSELTAIRTACQTGESIVVSDDVAYLIREGREFEQESQGYFNPAIGELIDAWGFLSQTSSQDRPAPKPEVIAKLLSYHPSMRDLYLVNHTLSCTNPHVRLDFGAYAKGYGVGKIMKYLQSQGVKEALVNAGGDLMILHDPENPALRIGIQSPDSDKAEAVLEISEDTSIFTSGTYARKFTDTESKKQFHHLINPKTGYPSTYFTSVTVLHPDPMIADAAATAILASDKESWPAIIRDMGIEKYLLITSEGERIDNIL